MVFKTLTVIKYLNTICFEDRCNFLGPSSLGTIGEFLTFNWENNILFGIGNGAEFRPQISANESPDLTLIMVFRRKVMYGRL